MKMERVSILKRLQRHLCLPKEGRRLWPSGVRIEDRRWQREINSLQRECETLKKRIGRSRNGGNLGASC